MDTKTEGNTEQCLWLEYVRAHLCCITVFTLIIGTGTDNDAEEVQKATGSVW